LNEFGVFKVYYQIGSGAATKLISRSGSIGSAPYDVTGEDPFAAWLTRVVAHHVERPLTRLWERFLDRMDW
jgi:hypothetical protein